MILYWSAYLTNLRLLSYLVRMAQVRRGQVATRAGKPAAALNNVSSDHSSDSYTSLAGNELNHGKE